MSFEKLEMKSLKKGVCVTQLTQDITEQELVTAVAMAAISRSDLPVDKLREKYLTINKNGEADYKRFLRENVKGYNHWSVLDHVLLHLNISGISQWVNKLLETFNLPEDLLPIAITELSTRYVDFSNIKSDDYYVIDSIKKDEDTLTAYKEIIDFQLDFYRESMELVKNYYINELNYPEKKAEIKSFDDCRNLLPDGTPTSVNISISFRALPEWIKKIQIKYYDKKNSELLFIISQLKEIMKQYDFIYDMEKFEKVLKCCNKIYEKNIEDFNEFTESNFIDYFKDLSYKEKDLLNEDDVPVSLSKPIVFFKDEEYPSDEIIEAIRYVILELNKEGVYKGNASFIKYLYNLSEIDLTIFIDSVIDFGAFRDISRHRSIAFNISGLPYSLNFPFIIGSDTLYNLDRDRFDNYINELKNKLLNFVYLLKKFDDIELYKFIFSYLIPMGAVKSFYIKGSLDQLLHLINERTNSGAHCQYKNFALSIASDLSNKIGIHTGYIVDDEDIKKQLND